MTDANIATEHGRGRLRFWILALLSTGIAINYVDRSALSVALPAMTHDMGLSATAGGILLSAFYWSYVVFQVPGGYLVDRFGPRVTFALGSLFWGVATAACGLARGAAMLFGTRLVLGAVEAPSYPASASTVGRWFPRQERSFASATYNNGSKIGGTLAIPIMSVLIAAIGWRASFVVIGVTAMAWALWWYVAYRDPREHDRISPAEIAYIEDNQEPETGAAMSLTALARTRTVQAMMAGFFCVNFVSYFFFTWFPTYLIDTYHMALLKFGLVGMLPGVAAIIGGWCGGLLSDGLVRLGFDLTLARKIPLVCGLLGSSAIGVAAFSPTVVVAMSALCVANFSSTLAAAALWALPADVAPSRANIASIGGIQNMAANLAGIVSPILIGVIMQFTHSFYVPLLLAGGVGLAGALIYGIWLPRVEPLRESTAR